MSVTADPGSHSVVMSMPVSLQAEQAGEIKINESVNKNNADFFQWSRHMKTLSAEDRGLSLCGPDGQNASICSKTTSLTLFILFYPTGDINGK